MQRQEAPEICVCWNRNEIYHNLLLEENERPIMPRIDGGRRPMFGFPPVVVPRNDDDDHDEFGSFVQSAAVLCGLVVKFFDS